ncbi:DUF5994 family protein [Mycolicibacterium sp. XJ1819]
MDHAAISADIPVSQLNSPPVSKRRWASSVRLTLTQLSGDSLDGGWWPHTASIARELPELIEALRDSLGEVVDIGVNWTAADGVPDLDSLTRRGVAAIPGWKDRNQRVMTVTGRDGRANLLVVPSKTTASLAVLVLRLAAALPIHTRHLDSATYRAAEDIVRAARTQLRVAAGLPAGPDEL